MEKWTNHQDQYQFIRQSNHSDDWENVVVSDANQVEIVHRQSTTDSIAYYGSFPNLTHVLLLIVVGSAISRLICQLVCICIYRVSCDRSRTHFSALFVSCVHVGFGPSSSALSCYIHTVCFDHIVTWHLADWWHLSCVTAAAQSIACPYVLTQSTDGNSLLNKTSIIWVYFCMPTKYWSGKRTAATVATATILEKGIER